MGLVAAARAVTSDPPAGGEVLAAPTTAAPDRGGPSPPTSGSPLTVPAPTSTTTTTTTTTLPQRPEDVVPAWTVGRPWGVVDGLTMFRGNPTRNWYGTGPVPTSPPRTLWSYPSSGGMCGQSSVGGEVRTWCGTGWTGQPVVWNRPDGVTEVIFGAYDKSVHFLDAATGEQTRPSFPTGDIIKGSVTLDPDGYPLLYTGSRDNKLRVIALDRDRPTELWALDAYVVPTVWNDDWDGNPVVVDDILYEGGENSWFFAILLNRGYDEDGHVVVEPEVLLAIPGFTQELIERVGRNVSIESSPAVFEQRVYFANSGGRVVGLDVSRIRQGEAPIVFDYWVGDDVDATVVIDGEGMLYVAVEDERKTARAAELGQLIKLDPYTDGDPYLWGVPDPGRGGADGGFWATPALAFDMLYIASHNGRLLAVDTANGEVTWEEPIAPHSWSSPVVIDEVLVAATCAGELRAYSLEDPRRPRPLWTHQLSESCIESTPAVWEGRIYVGSRDGRFYAVGE